MECKLNFDKNEGGVEPAIEWFSTVAQEDLIFRRALQLARHKDLCLAETLFFVYTFVSPPQPIRWDQLNHPSSQSCVAMSRATLKIAASIEANNSQDIDKDVVGIQNFSIYAICRAFLPCTVDEIITILGKQNTVARLRHFAEILRFSTMVS